VVTKDNGYVPISRRFPLAERKHRKQSAATAWSCAVPDDVELGSALVEQTKAASEYNNSNSPLYEQVVEVCPRVWPMVVLESSHHLVAVLPLVPQEALTRYEGLKKEAVERGVGLRHHDALASILQPLPSVLLAMEVATGLGRIISGVEKQQVTGNWEETYDKAYQFILDGIPAGVVLETSGESLEVMFNPQSPKNTRRRWF